MSKSALGSRREYTRLRFFPRFARSIRKRYYRGAYGEKQFVTSYFGAQFHVCMEDMVAREIALKNFERTQLRFFISACKRIRPDCFVDVGANIGLYSCILLTRGCAPSVVAFEPDRRNYEQLLANLQLNNLLQSVDCRQEAAGEISGRLRLIPGPPSNRGMSRIAAGNEGEEAVVVRLDDVLPFAEQALAIKIDIEGYELSALSGMSRLLLNNRGIAQIEALTGRAQTIEFMLAHGYRQIAEFYTDLVFEKD